MADLRRLARERFVAAMESDPREVLPYARHVSDEVIALDTGAYMMMFQAEGASFETADAADLNDWHGKLNSAWRNLADERLAVWHHLIRREHQGYPEGPFRSAFAAELDRAYAERLAGRRMYVNELYLSLVLHPAADRLSGAARKLGGMIEAADEEGLVGRLTQAGADLVQYLGRYALRPLGLYEDKGGWRSEPLEALKLLLAGGPEPVPLICGHLSQALYTERVIFGREAIEVRGAAESSYCGVFGIKEYPPATRPGAWNGLLGAAFPFALTHSFTFLSKPAARAVMERKQNQLLSSRDRAASQIEGLDVALDELISNHFVMGEHQASLLVRADSPAELTRRLSAARASLSEAGVVAAREDLAIEAAFWSQFPGNFRYRVRPAAITSRNFAALAPLHTHPAGRARGNHWGAAVALLRSSAGSPFHFSFHVGDVGHTFICGPSGSGKTIVQNFMLAQLEKLGASIALIDKDRGAEIFVRACEGSYLRLRNGEPTGFAPFKALGEAPADRAFLSALVRQLVGRSDAPLSAQEERAIDQGLAALLALPASQRSLAALRVLLGQRDPAGVGARLERWQDGGALGWALDGGEDLTVLSSPLLGFDMTDLLDNAEVRTPVMMYLIHRLTGLIDGRRMVIDIDEFWKALGDEAFRSLAQDGLKTFRKQNACMIFGTQSPADVLRSPIAHTIIEQCATKIYLPNPAAAERDYVHGFGLTQREFALVREELSADARQFLIKQGQNSVIAELRLDGMDDEVAVLSGRTETVDLLDRLRAQHGEAYATWREPFHHARRRLP